MNKHAELEKLCKQRTKLEDIMYEKGETPSRVIKLLGINEKICLLQEELNVNKR